MAQLSRGEVQYIVDGIACGVRGDGRGRLEFRELVVESGVIPSASGSTRIQLGGTDVLVGVKAELGDTDGHEGSIQFSVECSGVGSMLFEGRGASTLNAALTLSLDRLYSSGGSALDRSKLCVLPRKLAWTIFVDVLVLQVDGNLLDATSLAVRQALLTAVVPRIETISGDGDEDDEIEVDDDPTEQVPLPVGDLPIWLSLVQVGADEWIVDSTAAEETCMTSKISVGVDARGQLCGLEKSGGGGALSRQGIDARLDVARQVGLQVIEALDQHRGPLAEPIGFFS